MTKNRTIKHLKQQNERLRRQNLELKNKIPSAEYAEQLERALDRFENINDNLLQLYLERCHNQWQRRITYWKYRLAILWIKLQQRCSR